MKIAIVNGPNLNLTGTREPEVYGEQSFDQLMKQLKEGFHCDFVLHQSNVEGELINILQQLDAEKAVIGILLNAGGYTHTSVALGDTVAAIDTPVVEIHLSNIFARDAFRHVSYVGRHTIGSISGFGMESYVLGAKALLDLR